MATDEDESRGERKRLKLRPSGASSSPAPNEPAIGNAATHYCEGVEEWRHEESRWKVERAAKEEILDPVLFSRGPYQPFLCFESMSNK